VYLSIRRHILHPALTAGLGVLLSIIVITLMGLAQGNEIYQALFAGFIVGGLFCGGVLAMAWYFQTNEMRRRRQLEADGAPSETNDDTQPDDAGEDV